MATASVDKPQAKAIPKPGAKPESKDDLKAIPMPEWLAKLETSAEGLTQAQAQKRLTKYGPNEIKEEKTKSLGRFRRCWDP